MRLPMRWRWTGSVLKEKAALAIAWHMPRWLVYRCAVRLGAHATVPPYGDQVVPDLTFMDALDRWT